MTSEPIEPEGMDWQAFGTWFAIGLGALSCYLNFLTLYGGP